MDSSHSFAIKQVMDRYYSDPSKIAVLAGAGVSMDPPGSLPSALELMHIIIDELAPTRDVNQRLRQAVQANRSGRKGANNYIRMERLFSLVYPAGTEPNAILELKNAGAPNSSHFALANLIQRGGIVMTTNFDCLLEQACERMGVRYSLLVSNNDYEAYIRNQDKQSGSLIIKLHGSADRPETIQTTLEKIGTGKHGWGENQPRGMVFQQVLQERNLLVSGYSGSDDFDVIPAMIRTQSARSLLWVSHEDASDFEYATLCAINSMDENSRIGDIFLRLAAPKMDREASRNGSVLWEVRIATRELLHRIGKTDQQRTGIPAPHKSRVQEILRKDCRARYKDLSEKWHDSAILFEELWDIDDAIRCAQEGKKTASADASGTEAIFDAILGRLVFEKGEVPLALDYLDRAQSSAQKRHDLPTLSVILSKKAFILNQRGNARKAIQYLEKAIGIDTKLNNENWLAKDLEALAVTTSILDPTASLDYFDRVLEMARKSGDMQLELTTRNNLFLARGLESNDPQLIDSLQRAEELSIALGDLRGMVEVTGNRGSLFAAQGDWDKAVELMSKAQELAESIDYQEGIARWKSSIADIYRKRGELDKAIEGLLASLSIWNKLGVAHEIGTACGRLGLIYTDRNEYEKALYYLEQALEIDSAIEWTQGVVDDLGNLGMLHQSLGRNAEAIRYFAEAVEKARASNYDAALARNLGNLGMELSRMGNYEKAIQCDLEALSINEQIGNLEGEAYTRCNLAADYLQTNKKLQAIYQWEKALSIAKQMGNDRFAEEIRMILLMVRSQY